MRQRLGGKEVGKGDRDQKERKLKGRRETRRKEMGKGGGRPGERRWEKQKVPDSSESLSCLK
jgi:hypothetical protein